MEFKRLSSTDVMVPEIGLGTWRYRGGVEPLRRGIELGAQVHWASALSSKYDSGLP